MATVTARQIALLGHQLAARQPVACDETLRLDDNDRPVRGLLAALLSRRAIDWPQPSSGHGQPPRRRRRCVTRQGRSASGGPAQRVDPVTAVAFPAHSQARSPATVGSASRV